MDDGNYNCAPNYLSGLTSEEQELVRKQFRKEHPDRGLHTIKSQGGFIHELLARARQESQMA